MTAANLSPADRRRAVLRAGPDRIREVARALGVRVVERDDMPAGLHGVLLADGTLILDRRWGRPAAG